MLFFQFSFLGESDAQLGAQAMLLDPVNIGCFKSLKLFLLFELLLFLLELLKLAVSTLN